MKLWLLIPWLLAALVLASCDTPRESAAFRAVKAPAVGKLQFDQCEPYARDLAKRLNAQGIPARVLAVYYATDPWLKQPLQGHAIVLYTVEEKLWGMDNQQLKPIRVRNYSSDLEKARWFWSATGGNPWDIVSAH